MDKLLAPYGAKCSDGACGSGMNLVARPFVVWRERSPIHSLFQISKTRVIFTQIMRRPSIWLCKGFPKFSEHTPKLFFQLLLLTHELFRLIDFVMVSKLIHKRLTHADNIVGQVTVGYLVTKTVNDQSKN